MDSTQNEIDTYLDELIKDFVKNKDKINTLNKNLTVTINNKFLELNMWQEIIDNHMIYVFEIRDKNLLFDTVYIKGVIFDDDKYRILSHEEMWDYGF